MYTGLEPVSRNLGYYLGLLVTSLQECWIVVEKEKNRALSSLLFWFPFFLLSSFSHTSSLPNSGMGAWDISVQVGAP